ncbi:hypothetical protein ACFST9_05335 [Hymenobacter monticola]|uniref:Lipoprotein n=1 Tax=Hymenobacter monticola TaxID=1705399 RepID=A0ABY4BE32_9BACT|nr:hypothetical protein [Hymenobacter monticola]UOE36043.1 hypothetical protein MTP16_10465 [Hymenobacter monticola]
MELRKIGIAASLASGVAACTEHRNPAFVYPPSVVAAHEQAHYKTALWCTYTSLLDSSVFKKEPLNDSLAATLRGWLAVRRKLESIKQDSLTTCFRFKLAGPSSTILRFYNNSYRYGNTAFGLPVTIAVWVNRKDGLIDSVLDCYNRRRSAGFPVSFTEGRWQRTGPIDRKLFSYNVDQPCKAAFLQANSEKLRWDVRLLCIEKGILPH